MSEQYTPPTVVQVDNICRTPGCPNEGITFRSWADATTPIILCAPCGQFVTEIYPVDATPVTPPA